MGNFLLPQTCFSGNPLSDCFRMTMKMLLGYKIYGVVRHKPVSVFRNLFSVPCMLNHDLSTIRNIGILAHIDAGKTTTTERMLYYSGIIRNMGEVHHGNTVTDYMEQERDRGITITSASVTVPWAKHRINIIDTPGHIDFTMQVEQSLGVIDGAIIILDASAGVEAQTVTVWQQADKYKIPRIVYCNKMDRPDASLPLCVNSLKKKFDIEPLTLQIPIKGSKGISSIVDLIRCEYIEFHGEQGEKVVNVPVTKDDQIFEEMKKCRNSLIDKLTDLDEKFTDIVLGVESLDKVSIMDIYETIHRVTAQKKAVPVLCGSSYKNIGVQLLMDAVIYYLPSPNMRTDLDIYAALGDKLSAKVFKIVHEKRRGQITFLRIYTGSMTKNQRLYNVSRDLSENVTRLMEAYADDYEEVNEIKAGNIAAVTGFKNTVCGNVLTCSSTAAKSAIKYLASKNKITEAESAKLLYPPEIKPQPVFFCSVESPSLASQNQLDLALEQLQREDPSLTVTHDEQSNQTVLGGMGELHLEIIKSRILSEYKVEADLGPLQIAYKEQVMDKATETQSLNLVIGSTKHNVLLTMSVYPSDGSCDFLETDKSPDYAANTSAITMRKLILIQRGIESCLQHGPKIGCPVINTCFMIHWFQMTRGTADSVITSAASQCTQKLLSAVSTTLFEPLMQLEIVTDEEHMSLVMSNLTKRRGTIQEFNIRGGNRVIRALVPLSELLGYSKYLRTLTSGRASFTMEFNSYRLMCGVVEQEAIKDVTGFYQ